MMSLCMDDRMLVADRRGYWDGAFRSPAGTITDEFDVVDPATGERLARLPRLGAAETNAAIASARKLLSRPPALADRKTWLTAIANSLLEHQAELAYIITRENGKPLAEARAEVEYAAGFYRNAVVHVDSLAPRTLAEHPRDHLWTVHHRPAGIAGLITPWNFPLAMLAKKLSAAIAAGCPSVIKPSEKTPLSCIALFALLDRLALPAGLCNLVFGDAPAIGQALCSHPHVRVLSFTGSTAVGKQLAQQCAPHVKRVAMELGGNAPFVVFPDADLEAAIDHLMANKFRCSGQTCVCANRVLVHEDVVDRFQSLLVARVNALVVGSGLDASTQIGPMIDAQGFAKVRDAVVDAVARGARVLCGGPPGASEQRFFPPTVLVNVRPDMVCMRSEVFGPVVPMATFASESQAVALANDTPHGLAAYVFSGELEQARRVAAQLHFGHVGLNSATGPTPEAPFGGMLESGIGREGGLEGLLEFTELQTTATPRMDA